MVKWFTLKNKEGGKINLPPFIYFYSVINVTLSSDIPSSVS